MARAFSASGFGTRWLNCENSTSGSALSPTTLVSWARIVLEIKRPSAIMRIDDERTGDDAANLVRDAGILVWGAHAPRVRSPEVTPANGADGNRMSSRATRGISH